jgi:hypothetical protein
VPGIHKQEIIRRSAHGLQCSESRRTGSYDDDVDVRLDAMACSVDGKKYNDVPQSRVKNFVQFVCHGKGMEIGPSLSGSVQYC